MSDTVKLNRMEVAPDAWIHSIESTEFRALVDAKRRSILPMVVIYMGGYIGLSALAGFGHGILGIKVLGAVNLGFVLIAGNYVMSWILAIIYARISTNRHALVKEVVEKARNAWQPAY